MNFILSQSSLISVVVALLSSLSPLPQQQQKKCNKSPHPRIDSFGRLSLLLIFGIFSTHNFLSLFIGEVFFTSFHFFFFRFVLFARSRWILSVYFFLVVYDRSVVQFRIVTRIDESLLSRRDGDKQQPAVRSRALMLRCDDDGMKKTRRRQFRQFNDDF